MTLAIVIVFPEPVTPRSVWNRSPRSRPAVSSRMALGWSPAGLNGAWKSNCARAMAKYSAPSAFARYGPKPGDLLLGGSDALAARHFADAFYSPCRFDDLLEVREVFDFDHHCPVDLSIRGAEVHAADVGPGSGDGRGEIGVQAAAIGCLQREADDEPLAFGFLPVDLETPFGLVSQQQEIGTIRAVNADATPSGDIPDHGIARDRLTAL